MQAQVLPGDLREGVSLQIFPDISSEWCSGHTLRLHIVVQRKPRRVSCCTHMHTVLQFRSPTVRLRPVLSSALPASNDMWGGGQGYSSTEPLAPCCVPDKRERVPRDHLLDPFTSFPNRAVSSRGSKTRTVDRV